MQATFKAAFGYQGNALALPVTDLDATSRWYKQHMGLLEVRREDTPHPTVVMERDGVQLGFAINGGDASQDGAGILVSGIADIKAELTQRGAQVGESRVDEMKGKPFNVFFVIAPDGLCYYFHEPVNVE